MNLYKIQTSNEDVFKKFQEMEEQGLIEILDEITFLNNCCEREKYRDEKFATKSDLAESRYKLIKWTIILFMIQLAIFLGSILLYFQ